MRAAHNLNDVEWRYAAKLASAKTDQPNALTDATRAFQGYI